MSNPEGAVRKRRVPEEFRRKRVTNEEIFAWAREQLSGQEPDLHKDDIDRIKSGESTEVLLRPRRPGFFLPDGTFVEAFEHAPEFGDDLEEAEKKWNEEERDRKWVDQENGLFNKSVAKNHPKFGQVLWEHGKRIEAFARENARSVSRLLRALDRYRPAEGYARHTHQTALDFYRWQPGLSPSDPLLDWRWERIDAVLRFSNNNLVRTHLKNVLEGTELGGMRDDQLSRLLGIKTREPDVSLTPDEHSRLEALRKMLKRMETPDDSLVRESILTIEKAATLSGAGKTDGTEDLG